MTPTDFFLLAADWDEFPNGRWGDSRSPAYGDLDGYPVSIGITVSLPILMELLQLTSF